MRNRRLTFAELLNLEVLLVDDELLTSKQMQSLTSDFRGKNKTNDDRLEDTEVLRRWIQFRATDSRLPGAAYQQSVTAIRILISIIGLLLGAGTVGGLLAYDGSIPVNIVTYLGTLVGLQIGILFILGAHWTWGKISGRPQEFLFSSALRSVLQILTRKLRKRSDSEVESFTRLLRQVENAALVVVTQLFGVMFNLGAIAAFVFLITFTDVAFCWATTLNITAEEFKQIVDGIAIPFGYLGEVYVPSADIINDTQFIRLAGSYAPVVEGGGVVDSSTAGSWWRFALSVMVVYGLLPRVVVFALAKAKLGSLLAKDYRHCLRINDLIYRLTSEDVASPISKSSKEESQIELSSVKGKRVWMILWRDIPEPEKQEVADLKIELDGTCRIGGSSEDVDGTVLAGKLDPKKDYGFLVAVEDWESPGRAFVRLLKNLRDRFPESPVYILPVEANGQQWLKPSADRMEFWRRQTGQIANRHSDRMLGVAIRD